MDFKLTQYDGFRIIANKNTQSAIYRTTHAQIPFVRNFEIVARKTTKHEKRKKRHCHIRQKLSGTPERPRMAVFRSNDHIYAQVIDDTIGHTLCASSTLFKDIKKQLDDEKGNNKKAAYIVGKSVGAKCIEQGITKICFDRAGFKFHGRVKAVADGAREAGLDF